MVGPQDFKTGFDALNADIHHIVTDTPWHDYWDPRPWAGGSGCIGAQGATGDHQEREEEVRFQYILLLDRLW